MDLGRLEVDLLFRSYQVRGVKEMGRDKKVRRE